MDSTFKPPTNAATPHRPSKRLLLDRRYGLVIDEWEEPSKVALAGGRGMFCIVPLGKALFEKTSGLINLSASCIIDVLQNPDKLSPDILQATLSDRYHEFASSIRNPKSHFLGLSDPLPLRALQEALNQKLMNSS